MSAEVVRLDDWRDPERVLERAARGTVIPHDWHDLHMVGQTDKRDAIRMYARLGLHPILVHGIRAGGACTCGEKACEKPGKHPVERGWQRGALDVTKLDGALVRDWELNIGLRTGTQPNGRHLVVVDVDGPRDLLAPLELEHGVFPRTLTARTGRGGLHLFYWSRAELPTRVGVVERVDVRGRGGQVVAAPSLHASGNRYEWIDVCEPEVLP